MTTKKTLTQRFEELTSKALWAREDEITDLQGQLKGRKEKLFRATEECSLVLVQRLSYYDRSYNGLSEGKTGEDSF